MATAKQRKLRLDWPNGLSEKEHREGMRIARQGMDRYDSRGEHGFWYYMLAAWWLKHRKCLREMGAEV